MDVWLQPLFQVCLLIEALCDHAARDVSKHSYFYNDSLTAELKRLNTDLDMDLCHFCSS
jgi:hypothetical protein